MKFESLFIWQSININKIILSFWDAPTISKSNYSIK
jgi:hypothetical protein